jgi:hypothetical protein
MFEFNWGVFWAVLAALAIATFVWVRILTNLLELATGKREEELEKALR